MNNDNVQFSEVTRQQLKQARSLLILVQYSIPPVFEEYRQVEEMVELIEKLLGII